MINEAALVRLSDEQSYFILAGVLCGRIQSVFYEYVDPILKNISLFGVAAMVLPEAPRQ